MTEIAALHVSFGGGSRGWSSLVQLPKGMQVPKDTQRLTGIDDAMLAAEGVPFTAAYEQFLGLLRQELEGAEPGAYLLLIGHNIKCGWGFGGTVQGWGAAWGVGPGLQLALLCLTCRMTGMRRHFSASDSLPT